MKATTEKELKYIQHSFKPVRNKLLYKHSPAEERFEKLLIESDLYFRREKCNFTMFTRWSYFDFYIPYYNLYIEIDGHNHDTSEQQRIDAEKEKIVKDRAKFIVRFTNDEVLSMDTVSIDFLLAKCFEQSAGKRKKKGKEHSSNRYWAIMEKKRIQGVDDILKTANFQIDETQEVWLYDHAIGTYFKFDDIFQAKFSVEMSINEIHDLLEMHEYKKSTTRRFVFAYTQDECENRVADVYY